MTKPDVGKLYLMHLTGVYGWTYPAPTVHVDTLCSEENAIDCTRVHRRLVNNFGLVDSIEVVWRIALTLKDEAAKGIMPSRRQSHTESFRNQLRKYPAPRKLERERRKTPTFLFGVLNAHFIAGKLHSDHRRHFLPENRWWVRAD
jgi:hypothetical protein